MDDYPPIPPVEPAPVEPPVSRVRAIPEGNHTVTPHLVVRDGARALEFYAQAFGARELVRMPGPDGTSVMHSEIRIGDSAIYVADEFPAMGSISPQALKGTPVTIHLYVEDADATFDRAVAAGAKVRMPVADQFWGDRYGMLEDPFGHSWAVATHTEDVSPEEMGRRAAEYFAGMPPPPPPKRKAKPKAGSARKAAPRKKKAAARKKKKTVRKKAARKKVAGKKKAARKKTTRRKVASRKPARKKASRKKSTRKAGRKKKAAKKPARRGAAKKKKKNRSRR